MNPELRFLAHACGQAAGIPCPDPQLPTDPLHQKRVITLAAQHKIQEHLAQSPFLPAPLGTVLQMRRIHSRAARILTLNSLVTVQAALKTRGFTPLLLKGPVLSQQLYDDPLRRDYRDIDLLVSPWQPVHIDHIMQGQGYPGSGRIFDLLHHLDYHHQRSGNVVEIHSRVWKNHADLFSIPTDHIYQQAVSTTLPRQEAEPITVLTMSPDHTAMYVFAHAASHGFCLLGWLIDCAALLHQHPDPHRLYSTFQQHGLEPTARVATHMLTRHLGYRLPEPWHSLTLTRRLQTPAAFAQHQLATGGSRLNSALGITQMGIRFIPALAPRRRILAKQVVKTLLKAKLSDYSALPLPPALHFIYPIIRPVGILNRILKYRILRIRRSS